MSYILEALRKVEQQRENLSSHRLSPRRRYHTAVSAVAPSQRSLIVIGAVVAGAIVTGGVSVYLATSLQSTQPGSLPAVEGRVASTREEQTAHLPLAQNNPQRTTFSSAHGPAFAPPAQVPPVQPPLIREESPASEVVIEGVQPERMPPSNKESLSIQGSSTKASPPATASRQRRGRITAPEHIDHKKKPSQEGAAKHSSPVVKASPTIAGDVPRPPAVKENSAEEPALLSMLSPQLQDMVPKITIDGVVYSPDPKQRVAVINMKLYNEGQSTPEGIVVEAIRQDDIICSYQGQRFRLSR